MHRKKNYVFLFFLKLLLIQSLINPAYGQQYVRGCVQNEQGEKLPYATVQILDDSLNLLKYTTTNINGCFAISINEKRETINLLVRFLGYKEFSQKLKTNELPKDVSITLELLDESLKEVVIESSAYGVTVKDDSIFFHIDDFISGRETKLGELLNKLPGVQVNENTGEISINGKKVDHLLIDGEKIVSGQQGILTKNLPASAVAGVEAYINYQDPMVSRHSSHRTEHLALNITLTEQARKKWIGFGEVLGGYPNVYNAEGSFFRLKPGAKWISIVKLNNTGRPVFTFDDYVQTIGMLTMGDEGTSTLDPGIAQILSSNNEVEQRKSKLGYVSFDGRLNNKLRLSSYTLVHHAFQSEFSENNQRFLAESDDNMIQNAINGAGTSFLASSWTQADYKFNAENSLSYELSGILWKDDIQKFIRNEVRILSGDINFNRENKSINLKQRLIINNKLSRNIYWKTTLQQQFNDYNSAFLVLSDANLFMFSATGIQELWQMIDRRQHTIRGDHQWNFFIDKNLLSAKVGLLKEATKFSSYADGSKEDEAATYEEVNDFRSHFDLDRLLYTADITFEDQHGLLRYKVGGAYRGLESSRFNATTIDHFLFPYGSFEVHFASAHRLTLSYNSSIEPYQADTYNQGFLIRSFQQLTRNQLLPLDAALQQSLGLRYVRLDPLSNSMLLLNNKYQKGMNRLSYNTEAFSNYTISQELIAPLQHSFISNLFFDKKFNNLPLKLRFISNYAYHDRLRFVNMEPSNLEVHSVLNEVGLRYTWTENYELELGARSFWQVNKISFPKSSHEFRTLTPYALFLARYKTGFFYQIRTDFVSTRADSNLNRSVFQADVQLSYRKPTKKIEWVFDAYNITNFNSRIVSFLEVQPDVIINSSRAILPGYIAIGARYWLE